MTPTPIVGAFLIDTDVIVDERGYFSVAFAREAFEAAGLNPHVEQVNVSYNAAAGTLRGLHYQEAPFSEAKVVRCTRGAAFDVILDLRRSSVSYLQWFGIELSATNRQALYVPEAVAHGFQTLVADTEVLYTVSAPYTPSHYRGVRWDDPAFGIAWPHATNRVMHERDRTYPDFKR